MGKASAVNVQRIIKGEQSKVWAEFSSAAAAAAAASAAAVNISMQVSIN